MKQYDNFIDVPFTHQNLDLYFQRRSILQAIKDNLPLFKGKLLDAGCGKMPYRDFILSNSKVEEYVGLDIVTALTYDDQVKPDVTWDGKKMPFQDGSFDCIIATEVLEHVPNLESYLNEVFRVLRPKGVFFFTTPFLWPLHEAPHDEYRITPYSIERQLEKVGFHNTSISALGGWNASLAQMLGLWVRRGPFNLRTRKLLSIIFYPGIKFLISMDRPIIRDGSMITGVSGVALKETILK
jgi:SAM-dependent methyltransferase